MWNIPENIVILLEIFCGKISPKQLLKEGICLANLPIF